MSPREHVVRIIYEELVKTLGATREIPLQKQRILLVGLYGQGKTTTAGKLGKYFEKKGLSVGLIAADVHRPAAFDQLQQLSEQIKAGFYGNAKEKDAVKIVKEGVKALEAMDVLLVDSSGRHALEPDLIKEIESVAKALKADERLLVLDATIGQQAGPQAKAFHEAVSITGVIVTKLDGTAKGGGALSAVAEVKAPILFVGVGEKTDDLEKFDPPRFISRLLGMGDLETLLEKAQEAIDEAKAEELTKKIMAGKFTLHEMYEQIEMLTDMGPMKKIASLIPGLSGKMKDEEVEGTQTKLRRFKVIMDSMTDAEMTDPKMVKSSRVQRLARGAGVSPRDVKELLRHYEMSRKAIKGFAGNRKMRRQLLKQLADSGMDLEGLEDKA
jgi:signal recognition particle subunit SRP54